LRNNR